MRLIVYTERGTFQSKPNENATESQILEMKEMLQKCVTSGSHFTFETETGYVVLGKEVLQTAVFQIQVVDLNQHR